MLSHEDSTQIDFQLGQHILLEKGIYLAVSLQLCELDAQQRKVQGTRELLPDPPDSLVIVGRDIVIDSRDTANADAKINYLAVVFPPLPPGGQQLSPCEVWKAQDLVLLSKPDHLQMITYGGFCSSLFVISGVQEAHDTFNNCGRNMREVQLVLLALLSATSKQCPLRDLDEPRID